MKPKLIHALSTLLGISLFLASLLILHYELQVPHTHDIMRHIAALPPPRLMLALGLTCLSYLALTGYEYLAFRYIKHPLPFGKIASTSFIGNAFNNNVGFASLSGGVVRYRLYSAWGLSAVEIAQVVLFCAVTFWLGLLAIAGVIFLLEPMTLPSTLQLPWHSVHLLGTLFLVLVAAYFVEGLSRRKWFKLWEWTFAFPSFPLSLGQLTASAFDWLVAAGALYALLPMSPELSFPTFLGLYLLAQVAGIGSQVPGGLGVFETSMLLMLSPTFPAPAILGSLLAYRAIYYLFPLMLAAGLLGAHELFAHRVQVVRMAGVFGRWVPEIAPDVLALTTFVSGVVLLVSGATPSIPHRVAWLREFIPLPVTELSHFLGSIVGVGLLLLARGLQQRLNAAYLATVLLLSAGMIFSLLKGFDYEEAVELAIILGALIPYRSQFYRKTSLINERFTLGWVVAIGLALLGSIWLGLFSYRHVGYSHELWWQFSLSGDAPRFLRASVGAMCATLWVAIAMLLRPAQHRPITASHAECEQARAVIDRSPRTSAYLALLGDKTLLFNERGNAFLMYGVQGQSWIALGDPIGPEQELPELVWQFRELCDHYHGRAVFYDIGRANLPIYLDVGLTLLKVGEEARVFLEAFSLEGSASKGLRYAHRKVEKQGCTFEVAVNESVYQALPELRAISDAWLASKRTREKRFALGFFDEHYLRQCPIGLVRQQGRLVAFANLWLGAEKEECSVDLMRYRPEAPEGVMDYLFLELMCWGRQQGYRWFNLGTAPLAGFENRALAPVWTRIGAFMFRYGEHFYNFQGLRQYKTKFNPVWEPRFLACPGGLAIPRILLDVMALVAGGTTGIVMR